jgi:hypothetical protein
MATSSGPSFSYRIFTLLMGLEPVLGRSNMTSLVIGLLPCS